MGEGRAEVELMAGFGGRAREEWRSACRAGEAPGLPFLEVRPQPREVLQEAVGCTTAGGLTSSKVSN